MLSSTTTYALLWAKSKMYFAVCTVCMYILQVSGKRCESIVWYFLLNINSGAFCGIHKSHSVLRVSIVYWCSRRIQNQINSCHHCLCEKITRGPPLLSVELRIPVIMLWAFVTNKLRRGLPCLSSRDCVEIVHRRVP